MHQYGIDVNALDKFITRSEFKNELPSSRFVLIATPEFKLERLTLLKNGVFVLRSDSGFETTVFVESGSVLVKDGSLKGQEVVSLPPSSETPLTAKNDSVLYLFSGHAIEKGVSYYEVRKPFDYREKYWGDIQTIVSGAYAGKRIFVRRGENSSLEYHCRKSEAYFVHSGRLLLRLRAGRGEDRFFNLEEGMVSFTPPGLMHQRGGLEDTVIIEISTRDEDADSFLVEDGLKHKMPRLTD